MEEETHRKELAELKTKLVDAEANLSEQTKRKEDLEICHIEPNVRIGFSFSNWRKSWIINGNQYYFYHRDNLLAHISILPQWITID